MYNNETTGLSSLERALATALVTFSMFAVGYTASRAFFAQQTLDTSVTATTNTSIVPHQASMWSGLGR